MNLLAVIPARYASTRFPGKPLALIQGKPMIVRVYEQASKAFDHVCVATDDERIRETVEKAGGVAVMTSPDHNSGTDRCYEAWQRYSLDTGCTFDTVINVQGDEPFIRPEQLRELEACFRDPAVELATLVKRVRTREELLNPNSPKVVVDSQWNALYFSRSPIPFLRDGELTDRTVAQTRFYRHIGLYGYKAATLGKICAMPQSFLEKTEKLEQLRWIENGLKIRVAETEFETLAVDTPADLERLASTVFE